MKTLNLQFGMFCRYVKFGSKFCGSISWRKQWKQIRTAESQTIRLVVMILDRISDQHNATSESHTVRIFRLLPTGITVPTMKIGTYIYSLYYVLIICINSLLQIKDRVNNNNNKFSMARQPVTAQGLVTVEASRSHSQTRQDSSGE